MARKKLEASKESQTVKEVSRIEEDEPPYRLLCNEYPKAQ